MTEPPESAKPSYFSHEQIMRVMPGLALALFLAAMDQTIVAVALYSIAQDLNGVQLMAWIVSGYLLVATVATPIHGKLSDLFGRWPVLAGAIGIYLLASLLSAMAQTMPQLLAFRLLQGLGGGGLIVLVQTIIADIVPRAERGRYQAWLSGVFAIAAVAGPILGGVLTQYISWRAIFLINIPLGILAFWITRRGLQTLPVTRQRRPIDYLGTILLGAALTCLMLSLMWLGQGYSPAEPSILMLLLAAAVLLIALAFWERRAREPILPPGLFTNRVVMLCCMVLGLNFLVMYGAVVMVPLALQTVGDARADAVAVFMLPLTLGVPLGSFFSGKAMLHGDRHRFLLATGSLLSGCGMVLMSQVDLVPGWGTVIAMLVLGAGIGMTIPASIVAIQAAVEPKQIGIATATSGIFRTLGGAIGIAALSAVLFSTVHHGSNALKPASLRDQNAAAALSALPDALLTSGFQRAFVLAALFSLMALALALMLRRGEPDKPVR